MRDMWEHMPEVLTLCALVTFPTKLCYSNPTRCRRKLLISWETAEHSKGLQWIMRQYPHILPDVEKAGKMARGNIEKRELATGRRTSNAHLQAG
jgi:hypothetical protein